MPTPSRLLALALVAFVIVVATAAAATTRQPFKVTSTLDGKRVLPLRMHWLAYPKLRRSKVASIDFLIDGKVRWVEHHAPYNYASDDHGRNLGFLITTWLTAGPHRFTVRATDTIGQKSTDSVVARVLPAPKPPAGLAGMWTRAVTAATRLDDRDTPTGAGTTTSRPPLFARRLWPSALAISRRASIARAI